MLSVLEFDSPLSQRCSATEGVVSAGTVELPAVVVESTDSLLAAVVAVFEKSSTSEASVPSIIPRNERCSES